MEKGSLRDGRYVLVVCGSGMRRSGMSVCPALHWVDMIMLTTFAAHDPDESPLVVLNCGHALTVETLDGHLDMSAFYASHLVRIPLGFISYVK
ncbi:hypothetical protein SARC_13719 [Sphaeroforma arctica JP610]|uniref:Uncharacterized protein n=1 Tax=Sphaeroforma arctica JP610 TaxID=667725 RepID=A0A0L0FAF6_9EUKA|nr:hypothetical protein SARC_13719 [Sphaeroforma arctica JP610]KNC73724.1 hypothetical protein SARC_13719 [Sphaeroforma arctica JP610]|eukprot:XP_014147626.1 hypothetical protein SARC_13719 [Sphaeroforma arctica JP610]